MTWDNPMNRVVLGPEFLKEMEQEVVNIRKNLKAAQDRQKSYANKHRVHREFTVGVLLTIILPLCLTLVLPCKG